jgi:hypothetical protein
MIKVTIIDTNTRENKGVGKVSGKPYHMFFQNGYAHTHAKDGTLNPFPEKIELILEMDEHSKMPKPYAPGDYQLHPASLYVGKFGLEVAPKLIPLVKKA